MLNKHYFFLICFFFLQNAFAGSPLTRCLVGDDNTLFSVSDDIPERGFMVNAYIPKIQRDKATGNAANIKWIENRGDVKTMSTRIGRYLDHDITVVTYISKKRSIDYPDEPFSYVVFFLRPPKRQLLTYVPSLF